MNDDTTRAVSLTRLCHGRYEAVNARGGTIEFSTDREQTFTPVELFLASVAGCTAIDVDFITSKHSEPVRFEVSMTANKVRDEHGNHLVNLAMTFNVGFPDDEGGRTAAEALPDVITRTHDRLCTVSRTVEIGTPVATFIRRRRRTDLRAANGGTDEWAASWSVNLRRYSQFSPRRGACRKRPKRAVNDSLAEPVTARTSALGVVSMGSLSSLDGRL